MKKRMAIQVPCPGVVNDGVYGHSMRDGCYNCAPFWEQYPTCPDDHTQLLKSGYCRTCKKRFALPEHLDLTQYA